jgi:hypothetical protein
MSSVVEQALETIRVMRSQEESAYGVSDYLSTLPTMMPNSALETPVDASCRFVMAKWCSEIADFCNYKRETVAVAMNCLDRFMATPSGQEILLDRNLYQLSAMTALYSSVKIHEQEAMDPNLVSSLSRGAHSPQAVEAMESRMLNAIQWRVNPPTAMSFVRMMIDLVPEHMLGAAERETIVELTRFQIDMSINEYEFSRFDASSIAFACILNATESVSDDGAFHSTFESAMGGALGIDVRGLRDLRIALYELMSGCGDNIVLPQPSTSASMVLETSNCGEQIPKDCYYSSPRSVNA